MIRKRQRQKRLKIPKQISTANFGKEVTIRLATLGACTTTAGVAKTVFGLTTSLQAGNDWANLAATYQQFNIVHVRVQCLLPGIVNGTVAGPYGQVLGICYSTKDSTALSNINQIGDYEEYAYYELNGHGDKKKTFSIRPRPKIKPPQTTNDATENFGYVKLYSSDIGGGGSVWGGYYHFVFTVVFSGLA